MSVASLENNLHSLFNLTNSGRVRTTFLGERRIEHQTAERFVSMSLESVIQELHSLSLSCRDHQFSLNLRVTGINAIVALRVRVSDSENELKNRNLITRICNWIREYFHPLSYYLIRSSKEYTPDAEFGIVDHFKAFTPDQCRRDIGFSDFRTEAEHEQGYLHHFSYKVPPVMYIKEQALRDRVIDEL